MALLDNFIFIPPNDWWSLNGTVTVTGGTIDPDYRSAWAADGRPGYPIRFQDGTFGLSIANASGIINVVAICHHLIDAGNAIAIGGSVSGTITPGTVPPNNVPLNPWTLIDPEVSGATTLTVSGSGNSVAAIIGEVVAGHGREITPTKVDDSEYTIDDFANELGGPFLSVLPYPQDEEARMLKGSQYYSTSDKDILVNGFRAQRSQSRPSLLIPDPDLNDAWLGFLAPPTVKKAGDDLWQVGIEFRELPRGRW